MLVILWVFAFNVTMCIRMMMMTRCAKLIFLRQASCCSM